MWTKVEGQRNIYLDCGRFICLGLHGRNVKCMYTSSPGHIIDCIKFIWGMYTDIVFSCAHELTGIYGISMAFEGHICCWLICSYSIISKSCKCLFTCMFSNEGSTCRHRWAVGYTSVMWQAYLFRKDDIYMKYVYTITYGNIFASGELILGMYTDILVFYLVMNLLAYVTYMDWGVYFLPAHIAVAW